MTLVPIPGEEREAFIGVCRGCGADREMITELAITVGLEHDSDTEDHVYRDLTCRICNRIWQDKYQLKAQEVFDEGTGPR